MYRIALALALVTAVTCSANGQTATTTPEQNRIVNTAYDEAAQDAQEQSVTLSGGVAGVGACVDLGVSLCDGAGGFYAEGRFRSGWVGGYAGGAYLEHRWAGNGVIANLGLAVFPGPEAWVVRPVIRAGYHVGGDGFLTLGAGAEFGRRLGGEVMVDWGKPFDFVSVAVVRIGAVYRFGR